MKDLSLLQIRLSLLQSHLICNLRVIKEQKTRNQSFGKERDMKTAILKFHITLLSDSISDKAITVYPVLLVKRLNGYICVPGPKGSSLSLSLKHLLAAPASEAISPKVLPAQYKV